MTGLSRCLRTLASQPHSPPILLARTRAIFARPTNASLVSYRGAVHTPKIEYGPGQAPPPPVPFDESFPEGNHGRRHMHPEWEGMAPIFEAALKKDIVKSAYDTQLIKNAQKGKGLTPPEWRTMRKLRDKLTSRLTEDSVTMLAWTRKKLKLVEAGTMSYAAVENVIRSASHRFNNVSSWNALYAHMLNNWSASKPGRLGEVTRAYRRMRKTGMVPDTYTYIALFTGYANVCEQVWNRKFPWHPPKSLAKTLMHCVDRIFAFWFALIEPHSILKPLTMITNAALNVCSRAGDLGAMWSIIDKVPEKGEYSLDAKSYSIVLTAIRRSMMDLDESQMEFCEFYNEARGKKAIDPEKAKANGVKDGKRVWAAILHRWKVGEIAMDARLVVAMAKLLLESKDRNDWHAVPLLFHQVCDIPVLHEPKHDNQKAAGKKAKRADVSTKDVFAKQDLPSLPVDQMDSLDQNLLLSALLEMCAKTSDYTAAKAYWKHFTERTDDAKSAIAVDVMSADLLLRMARQHRDVQQANLVMHTLAKHQAATSDWLRHSTMRLAMSTCIRATTDPSAFEYATRFFDIMIKNLFPLDVRAAAWYLELAMKHGIQHGKVVSKDVVHIALHRISQLRFLLDKPEFDVQPFDRNPKVHYDRIDARDLLARMRIFLDAGRKLVDTRDPSPVWTVRLRELQKMVPARLQILEAHTGPSQPKDFSDPPHTTTTDSSPPDPSTPSTLPPETTSFPPDLEPLDPLDQPSSPPSLEFARLRPNLYPRSDPGDLDNRTHARARAHLDSIHLTPTTPGFDGTAAERLRRQIRKNANAEYARAMLEEGREQGDSGGRVQSNEMKNTPSRFEQDGVSSPLNGLDELQGAGMEEAERPEHSDSFPYRLLKRTRTENRTDERQPAKERKDYRTLRLRTTDRGGADRLMPMVRGRRGKVEEDDEIAKPDANYFNEWRAAHAPLYHRSQSKRADPNPFDEAEPDADYTPSPRSQSRRTNTLPNPFEKGNDDDATLLEQAQRDAEKPRTKSQEYYLNEVRKPNWRKLIEDKGKGRTKKQRSPWERRGRLTSGD